MAFWPEANQQSGNLSVSKQYNAIVAYVDSYFIQARNPLICRKYFNVANSNIF